MPNQLYAKSFLNGELHTSPLREAFPEIDFDTNCVIIYAAFCNQNFTGMSIDEIYSIRKELLTNHNPLKKYYFDCILEGVVLPVITNIHKIIDGIIEPKNVYYFTSSLNGKHLYAKYVLEQKITEPINVKTENFFEQCSRVLRSPGKYQIKNKEKLFLSYNRVFKEHRTAFIGLLEEKGLREKAYYSYLIINHVGYTATVDDLLRSCDSWMTPETYTIIKRNIYKLYPSMPIKLNIEPNVNMTWIIESDFAYFENSYFSFITESFFDGVYNFPAEHSIFFSEKIFKPIMMKHPFILAGPHHSLAYLRKEQYKTFHPFIDETYDTIENPELRMLTIVNEIERLSRFTDEQWIEWQKNISDIVEYNYKIFLMKSKEKWKKNIDLEKLL